MTDKSIPHSNELGFRQFILDPKTSVKTYLSQSLLDENSGNMENYGQHLHPSSPYVQHSQPTNQEVNHYTGIGPSFNGIYGAAPQLDGGSTYSSLSQQYSQHQDSSYEVPPLQQSPYQHSLENSTGPSSSPTPTGQQQPPPPTTANSQTRYGPAPPPLDSINEVAIKAPRTYHRMIVEFETLKAAFYSAKASEFLSSPSTPRAQKSNPFTSQIPTISISARLLPSSRHPRATSGLYVSHARPNLSIPTLSMSTSSLCGKRSSSCGLTCLKI
jgi:hypothetical protein